MIIDVVLAVNSESSIAPVNIHRMQRRRAKTDLGVLSPYLNDSRDKNQILITLQISG